MKGLESLVRDPGEQTDEVDLGRESTVRSEMSGYARSKSHGTYIMNGMMAIEIQPERVASGGLWPIW